jgi:Uma2 family endonuclease
MATVHTPSPTDQRFVLPGVSWRAYERLLHVSADRPSVRLTYDRGLLEIMTPCHEHESQSYLLARLVDALTEELALPVNGGRSTTFKRRKRQRGLEADSCWWIASEPLVRGKLVIDLRSDPPPELALEIDITSSSLKRMAIYARLNFPEIWRSEAQTIVCHLLGSDGKYTVSSVSRAIPGLVVADLVPFLNLRGQMDENAIVRQFRAWVRQRFGTGGQTTP